MDVSPYVTNFLLTLIPHDDKYGRLVFKLPTDSYPLLTKKPHTGSTIAKVGSTIAKVVSCVGASVKLPVGSCHRITKMHTWGGYDLYKLCENLYAGFESLEQQVDSTIEATENAIRDYDKSKVEQLLENNPTIATKPYGLNKTTLLSWTLDLLSTQVEANAPHKKIRDTHYAIVALLSSGANVEDKGENGETALHRAAKEGLPIAAYLIAKGAQTSELDNNGLTPLEHVLERKRKRADFPGCSYWYVEKVLKGEFKPRSLESIMGMLIHGGCVPDYQARLPINAITDPALLSLARTMGGLEVDTHVEEASHVENNNKRRKLTHKA